MRIRRTLAALGLLLLVLASVATAQDVKILQQNASTGNGTVLTVTGLAALGLQIAGVAAGADRVVNWEVSENQTVFGAVMCQNVETLALATTAIVNGTTSQVWRCPVAGMTRFRARLSGGTTGTVNVTVTGTSVSAQGQIGPTDACRNDDTQPDITVDVTAVVIVAPNQVLCGALLVNMGAQPLRCRNTSFGDPTSTLGWPLVSGGIADLSIDAQKGVKCIRDSTATASTTVNVTLRYP